MYWYHSSCDNLISGLKCFTKVSAIFLVKASHIFQLTFAANGVENYQSSTQDTGQHPSQLGPGGFGIFPRRSLSFLISLTRV